MRLSMELISELQEKMNAELSLESDLNESWFPGKKKPRVGEVVYYLPNRTDYKIQKSAISDFRLIPSRHHGPLLPYFELLLENGDKVKYDDTFQSLDEARQHVIHVLEADIRIREHRIAALQQELRFRQQFLKQMQRNK